LAFIRPEHQGSGVFRKLFSMLLELADQQHIAEISVHASLMAQPAFSAMGFEIINKEIVELGDHEFERFEMKMVLTK
jgi:putative acetyltransferase